MNWEKVKPGLYVCGKWRLRYVGKTSYKVESEEADGSIKSWGPDGGKALHSFKEAQELAESLAGNGE